MKGLGGDGTKRKILFWSVGIFFVAFGIAFLGTAIKADCLVKSWQKQIDYNKALMEKAFSYPEGLYETTVEMESHIHILIDRMNTFFALTIIFISVGLILIASSKVLLLGILILLITIPVATTEISLEGRWYASVFLVQPRNSMAVTGTIYVYDNILAENNSDAFVSFRMLVERNYYDSGKKMWYREWVEAGVFENQSGFWVFAASATRNTGYILNCFKKFDGNNADGNLYGKYTIMVSDNKTTAYLETEGTNMGTNICFLPTDPSGGSHKLIEAEMTIPGDNLYRIGSESNDAQNTLTGHYDELRYYDDGWKAWQQISMYNIPPYQVQMCSTDEFKTYRESSAGSLGHGGGHFAMSDVRD